MPITSSRIISQTPQEDGRILVVERHTDHYGTEHDVQYLAAADLDLEAVLVARGANIFAAIDMRDAVEAEAHNFELPLSQVEFLKRFTPQERQNVYVAKRTDEQVEDVWNFVMAAINGIYLNDPVTVGGLALLEAKGLIDAGRAAEIGAP